MAFSQNLSFRRGFSASLLLEGKKNMQVAPSPPGQSGSKVRRTAATLLSPLDLSSDKEKDKEDQQNYSVERYLLQLE